MRTLTLLLPVLLEHQPERELRELSEAVGRKDPAEGVAPVPRRSGRSQRHDRHPLGLHHLRGARDHVPRVHAAALLRGRLTTGEQY